MRVSGRAVSLVILCAGAGASDLLLLGRGSEVARAGLIPLALWVWGAAVIPVGPVLAAIQAVAVTAVAFAVGGPGVPGAWTPSATDAIVIYSLLALAGMLAAARQPPKPVRPGPADALGPFRIPARAVTLARRIFSSRYTAVAIPVVLSGLCCCGSIAALPVHPARPPAGLVYPLPADVLTPSETMVCGPGPWVTCTWTIDVDSPAEPTPVLSSRILEHLTAGHGWPPEQPDGRCRAWGWIIQEHACLTVESRLVRYPMRDLDGTWFVSASEQLTITIRYW